MNYPWVRSDELVAGYLDLSKAWRICVDGPYGGTYWVVADFLPSTTVRVKSFDRLDLAESWLAGVFA